MAQLIKRKEKLSLLNSVFDFKNDDDQFSAGVHTYACVCAHTHARA